ncbi:hypothetical protein EHW64_18745 [Erwinia psidii]|uniref:hypothetical protein n=1 Tax=Erwinia psidii TaxID=69224 RepID=UPI00226B6967|nr:hypothetical protein [Erwinia psidii]MCX8963096.1 hypothetical protein [Erwinia psidii]
MKKLSFRVSTLNVYFYSFINAVTFSFIKAPAFILFLFTLILYAKGTLTLGWIDEGRRLTQDAPAGMVKTCVINASENTPIKYVDSIPAAPDKVYSISAAPDKNSILCKPSTELASVYARKFDAQITKLYLMIALISCGIWTVLTKFDKRNRYDK